MKYVSLVFIWLLGACESLPPRQDGAPVEVAAPSAALIRTTLFVPDFDPVFALYRDILGFEVVYNAPYPGTTFRKLFNLAEDEPVEFAILKSPDPQSATIGLLKTKATPAKEIDPSAYEAQYGETILFMTTNDLDGAYAKVQAAGPGVVTVVAPPFATNGGREMVIADANGVRMYVFEAE